MLLSEKAGCGARSLKRTLDVVVAGAGLIVAAPLIVMVAAAIRLLMGSPVLFRQERLGFGERVFRVTKFRTMTMESSLPDGERLTAMGAWLRRTSLDELPQLLDILRGEMSFVGPRPLLVRYRPFFRDEERRRHAVIPGLTGWAQIHGRNQLRWDERLALDAWYVDHWSLWLDARIVLRTAMCVLTRRGVEADPTALVG